MQLYPSKEPQKPAATHETSRQTGFAENWSSALGLTITEDLPLTSRMIPTVTESQRNKKLMDYKKAGTIPERIFNFYGDDTEGLAFYARETLGLKDIPSQEEFEKRKLEEYGTYRAMSGRVSAQQSKMGFVGEMAGRMHAMALDPIYATSFLTGYGGAATVGQAALRVGLMEAGIETVAQPFKMAWKEEVGADYGAADAVAEIAFAGIGGAALAGMGKGLEKALTSKDITVAQGIDAIKRMAKKNPEMEPVLNTLKHADPEDNLSKVLNADESVDINSANQGPRTGVDPKADPEIKVSEIEVLDEEMYKARSGILSDEGVPRGTPKKEAPEPKEPAKPPVDDRHPLVVEADKVVADTDDAIKLMEECF